MNLPEKLKAIEIKSGCVQCQLEHNGECFDIECHTNAVYCGEVRGSNNQLKADQETYTQALEKIKELEVLVAGAGLQGAKEGYQSIIKEQAEKLAQLEETALTKEEAGFIVEYFGVTDSASDFYLNSIPFYTQVIAKLQKIINKR